MEEERYCKANQKRENRRPVLIDPLLSLAVSMHAQKGIYAILLGSGVSRSAGIPTGWEIVLDLASRLARVSGENYEGETAASWYTSKYSRPPDYSGLLDALAATPAERQRLLRGYFEPTEGEAEQGIKSPMPAHRAIAELVSDGQVRVVLTTNFDHLVERAIEARFERVFPKHKTVKLANASHFLQEDVGEQIAEEIRVFLTEST
jgi:hypothetical protein